jgi:hypothetical protein
MARTAPLNGEVNLLQHTVLKEHDKKVEVKRNCPEIWSLRTTQDDPLCLSQLVPQRTGASLDPSIWKTFHHPVYFAYIITVPLNSCHDTWPSEPPENKGDCIHHRYPSYLVSGIQFPITSFSCIRILPQSHHHIALSTPNTSAL